MKVSSFILNEVMGKNVRTGVQNSWFESSLCPLLGFHGSSVGKESPCDAGDPGSISGSGTIPWRRDRLPTPVFLGFPYGPSGKESACNVRDMGSIPGSGRLPGEGKGYPLQYSGLENSMNSIIRGVPKSWTRLSDFHFHLMPFAVVLFLSSLDLLVLQLPPLK